MMKSQVEVISRPELVVMAAGIGSRYGGLKQIESIGPRGEIILDYSIYDAIQTGFGKIIFVINREIEQAFRARIDQTIGKHCEVVFVNQELDNLPEGIAIPEERLRPWGTAHAVLSCKNVIDGPFAVINADDFYGRTSFQSLGAYLRGAPELEGLANYSVVGFKLANTLSEFGSVSRGVCVVDENGNLLEVVERKRIEKFNERIKYTEDGVTWVEIPGESVVSMNMWGFTPHVLNELQERFAQFLVKNQQNLVDVEYFLPEVVNQILAEKKANVKVLPTVERWFGVTYQEDKLRVQSEVQDLISQGVYPDDLWG